MKPDLAVALGNKAKTLMDGFRDRVKRDPDVADFAGGFTMVLKEHGIDVSVYTEPEQECLVKAHKRGDVMFTLVGQDHSAPAVLCEWIKLNIETAPPEKLRHALEKALAMRARPGRKTAD
jgi:hypothetical protein